MNPFSEVTGFLDGAIAVAVVLIGVSLLLTFVRLIKGPSLADRVVALDLLTVLAMGIIGLRVIATGGVADVVGPHARRIERVDPLLTLEGLRLIAERTG